MGGRERPGSSPGSIFPGRSGKLLRGDFRIAPELRGDYGLCWAFGMGNEACRLLKWGSAHNCNWIASSAPILPWIAQALQSYF